VSARMNNTRRGIAYHEAAHAVASRYLGRPVHSVTIQLNEGRLDCLLERQAKAQPVSKETSLTLPSVIVQPVT